MKKLQTIFMIGLMSIFLLAQSSPSHLNTLTSAATTLTTSWQDLGSEVNLTRTGIGTAWKRITLYIDTDINDGANIQIRLFYAVATGEERIALIQTASATLVDYEPEIHQLPDADPDSGDVNKFIVTFEIDAAVSFVQFQVKALTAGAPAAAQIDLSKYSLSKM